jgi:fermentation-respiration switch protein FrsA (DUF1100 family)
MSQDTHNSNEISLALQSVEEGEQHDGIRDVRLNTDRGTIHTRLQLADGETAILWVFGAGGGFGGPAGGLYTRLGRQLVSENVTSMELNYRHPGDLVECILDCLAGIALLEHLGSERIIAVGHSFGGAVVINVGLMSDAVSAVAALSSQSHGAEAVEDLAPKPLFLAHGEEDEILPDACSRSLFRQAGEPKELHLYPGCHHGLDACREELDRDLLAWLRRVAA